LRTRDVSRLGTIRLLYKKSPSSRTPSRYYNIHLLKVESVFSNGQAYMEFSVIMSFGWTAFDLVERYNAFRHSVYRVKENVHEVRRIFKRTYGDLGSAQFFCGRILHQQLEKGYYVAELPTLDLGQATDINAGMTTERRLRNFESRRSG
jgi:hypothetical protein